MLINLGDLKNIMMEYFESISHEDAFADNLLP